jgi:hypothetical protein
VSADPRTRPAIGALRRQRAEQTARTEDRPDGPSVAPTLTPASEAPAAPVATSLEDAAVGRPPDRDTLVEAWGDLLLRSLPARAKALYSSGRFTSVEGSSAVFALPGVGYLRRCEEVRPLVEQALTTHFGTPLSLRLVVDEPGEAEGHPSAPAGARSAGADPADLGDDDFDPEDPGEPIEVESLVRSRLLEAFPGAEEVTS